ncbi:hypothetical protein TB1_003678 [Malus domestica]
MVISREFITNGSPERFVLQRPPTSYPTSFNYKAFGGYSLSPALYVLLLYSFTCSPCYASSNAIPPKLKIILSLRATETSALVLP